MGKSREEKRRKDNCLECKNFKPIKAKNMCQNCWHKVKRKTDKRFWASTRYTEVYQRCNNLNNASSFYYNGLPVCSREEFINFVLNDESFNRLFSEWRDHNYEIKYGPSIDRIDPKKGYTLDNIQIISHSENSLKDQEMTPVICYKLSGQYVGNFESQAEAARQLKLQQANIFKCLQGTRKHTGGYRFEYA